MSALIVAAALVDNLTRPALLLGARRTYPAAEAGRWELPGGKVEPGENPRAALRRELAEELSITVILGTQILGPVGGDWPIAPGRLRVWLAQAASSPQVGRDHDELRWFTAADLLTVDWLAGDIPLIHSLQGLLQTDPCPSGRD